MIGQKSCIANIKTISRIDLPVHDKEISIATIPTLMITPTPMPSRFRPPEARQKQIYPDVLRCRLETRRIQFCFYFLIWPSSDLLNLISCGCIVLWYPNISATRKQPNKNVNGCCQTVDKLFYFLLIQCLLKVLLTLEVQHWYSGLNVGVFR